MKELLNEIDRRIRKALRTYERGAGRYAIESGVTSSNPTPGGSTPASDLPLHASSHEYAGVDPLALTELHGSLGDLLNVAVPDPTDGQSLVYVAASNDWEAGSPVAAMGALDDLTDVDAPDPSNGQALVYVAANQVWEPGNPSAQMGSLDDLSDVAVVDPQNGQMLVYLAANDDWEVGNAIVRNTYACVISGTLTASTSVPIAGVYLKVPAASTIEAVDVTAATAPTGASAIFDIHLIPVADIESDFTGTTIYSTQGNRPTLAATDQHVAATAPDVTALAQGDVLVFYCDQIGSTIAGAGVAINIRAKQVAQVT